ncbi:hypothetical protein CASFOL_025044 [Castilleja foliolosa]|uniref:Protein BIG GRAIN 1-like B n=1 Tax=Castilleja foliolosa TaxID=1961234 RepID=A0ABD3CQ16_9LAMI
MEIGISHHHSPSFSSTLLDSIYRSIDQGEDEMAIYREAMRKNKQSYATAAVLKSDEETANFRRACMVEKWMEKKVCEKTVDRRKFTADLQTKKPRKSDLPENSSWSSSDSIGGGFFSSSEAESFPLPRPKPVRTGGSGLEKLKLGQNHFDPELDRRVKRVSAGELDPKSKDEGGFLKTKSRAMRIYGDLKKVKQPISPGGKLAGFLNSLFAGAGKPKTASRGEDYSPSLKSTNASTCSSASSFSRSCLSKTPSSRGKSSNGTVKRSVRFSPVSVIVDENCGTLRQNNYTNKQASIPETKSIRNVIDEEIRAHVMEKNRRVEVAAKDMLRNYQMKTRASGRDQSEFSIDNLKKSDVIKTRSINQGFDYEEDDDAASYASSDLFELDNLSAIGMDQRYREELPVYETTQLHRTNYETTQLHRTNRALANSMIF